MVKGKGRSSGFSAEKIQVNLLRGSIGNGMFARLANCAARGPAAFMSVPQETFSPVDSVSASALLPAALSWISMASLWIYSAPFFRAERRHHSNMVLPSK